MTPFVLYGQSRSHVVAATRGMTMIKRVLCLSLLAAAGAAQAQDAAGCPKLPDSAILAWEHRSTGDTDFCRALRPDGTEAFGVYIARKAPFEPKRGNRVEEDTIDGQAIHWYRSEVAGRPNVETRETLVKLPDGRVAHIWLQANSAERLKEELATARGMRFQAERLSSN